jgi:serine/threonine protein kinase
MMSELQTATNPMASGAGASAEHSKQKGEVAADTTLSDAKFDPVGQFPVNDAARALYARQWLSQGKSNGKEPLHAVDYADIAKATENFDTGHKIGGGASCIVYKADLFGVSCAIKVLNEPVVADAAHVWEEKQFIAEMVLLERVRHPNVCRLYAVSTNSTNKCLVLELMEASLDTRLGWYAEEQEAEQKSAGQQVSKPQPRLSWQQRLNIAVCSCRGIVQLHQQEPTVVHRDIKSQNLLICGFDTPQADPRAGRVTLADFGTARQEQQSAAAQCYASTGIFEVTGTVVGTGPYMPTECECALSVCSLHALCSAPLLCPSVLPLCSSPLFCPSHSHSLNSPSCLFVQMSTKVTSVY